ncbi:MAG TPA: DUF2017 family protein [Chthoniobacteraceae bacterium]|jgi:hypothetical protein
MVIQRLDDEEGIVLGKVDGFVTELLRGIITHAQSDDPHVQRRLFSEPTGGREPEFEGEWAEYVHPDLQDTFRSALDVVQGDIAHLSQTNFPAAVKIPIHHLDAWLSGLNQARLAISERYRFTEEEMEEEMGGGQDARTMALFQMHFYGLLMECFLQQLDEL